VLELLSDTEYHGIEICLPAPALVVRLKLTANALDKGEVDGQ